MGTLQDKISALRTGGLTAEENVRQMLERIGKDNKKYNAILHLNEHAIQEAQEIDKKIQKGKSGKLAGLTVAVKSNISVQGLPITCASRTLEHYRGSFDADAIERIKKEGGIIIGMANMDEFACGASGEASAFGPTQNPAAIGHIPGGSSSGSAAAVAAGFCDLAIGSDTGGSIRNPASHCGIVGLKPSYGRVSRYGLIDLSMSLDVIGPLARESFGAALMMEVIAGQSRLDPTTCDKAVPLYTKSIGKKIPKLTIGTCPAFEELCTDTRIAGKVQDATEQYAAEMGAKIKKIELPQIKLAVQTYYPLVYVEFFSGTRKFDGRKYGAKIEDACGEEVLRRILGGLEISRAEYHGRYYRKALAARRVITESMQKAFSSVDVIMAPTTPMLPHKVGSPIETTAMYAYDAFTIPSSLAGTAAGVVPIGTIDGIPVGLQVMAGAFKEDLLLNVMSGAEKTINK